MSYPPGIPEHICDKFTELSLQVKSRGFAKYSARAILHRLRWHYQIERGDIHFKINNNYSARLARWFMRMNAGTDGFFEIRKPPHTAHDMHGYRPPEDI
jgi:hypothetical protein